MGVVLCEEEVMMGWESSGGGEAPSRLWGGGQPFRPSRWCFEEGSSQPVAHLPPSSGLCCQGRWQESEQSSGKSLLPREPSCHLPCAQEPVPPPGASWYLPSSQCEESVPSRSPSWSCSFTVVYASCPGLSSSIRWPLPPPLGSGGRRVTFPVDTGED